MQMQIQIYFLLFWNEKGRFTHARLEHSSGIKTTTTLEWFLMKKSRAEKIFIRINIFSHGFWLQGVEYGGSDWNLKGFWCPIAHGVKTGSGFQI